ncbi:MAG: 50S ribosomal protein L10 [Defluviitaleaceae bacterium]|nr:50S ribosomal protein L10 [Defluviitaleaceae bacterium]
MPKIEQKQVVVNEIKEKLDKASSIVLVNARGLTVEQDTILRRKLREGGVDYKVYKNSMVSFAVEGTDFEEIKPHLVGPSALAISYDDATAAARIISKELKAMPVLEFKAGVIGKELYDAKGVAAIANIPGREELLSRLLGSLKSPLSSFARLINQIAESKANGSDAPAPTEEPVAETPVVAEEAPAQEPVAEVATEEPVAEEEPQAE